MSDLIPAPGFDPHRCDVGLGGVAWAGDTIGVGGLSRCGDCGQWWVLRRGARGLVWRRVRWWNFRLLNRIELYRERTANEPLMRAYAPPPQREPDPFS